MDDDRAPALRASDADREQTADMLRRAAGEGRLTMDELDERLQSAYASRTRSELERLTADVLVPGEATGAAPHRLPVRPGDGGARWLVAVMSGLERKGRWRVASRATLVNFIGGSDVDLNDAELAAEQTDLYVISIMGGSDVRVPDGLNVEVSDFSLMGANSVRIGDARPDPGGPLLRLHLVSIMGGTDVKRGRKLTRAQRKEAKRLERSRHDQLGPHA